jgi:glycosyltransferase involved in cell wall biosynthesis
LLAAIRAAARELSPDVLHAHGWAEMAGAKVAAERQIPLVVTLHDYGLLCPQRSLFSGDGPCSHFASIRCVRCPGSTQSPAKRLGLAAALRLYARRPPAELYIAVAEYVAALHDATLRTRHTVVIPNFIDVEPGAAIPAPFPQRPVALFVGPDSAYKGAPDFYAASDLLRQRRWPGSFVHVGGATTTGAAGVRATGRLGATRLAEHYGEASVVVAPARYADPCPTVLMEAMAQGRPVLASDVGGHRDIVRHGAGELFPPGDVAALASAIERMTSSPDKLQGFATGALRQVQQFSAATVVPRIERAYQAALGQGGS